MYTLQDWIKFDCFSLTDYDNDQGGGDKKI